MGTRHQTSAVSKRATMQVSILQLTIWAVLCQLGYMMNGLDIDPNDELDDDQFRAKFGLRRIRSRSLKAKRQRALKQHEADIKKANVAYAQGRQTWYERVNDFSDLTDDEVSAAKTGMKKTKGAKQGRRQGRRRGRGRGRGLIQHHHVDERSERFFDQFRFSRQSVPSSYDAVKKGFVSPVKNQKQCGSCTAFATIAAVETCYKKITGKFGDYSEQELVDCGYHGAEGAKGCNGAYIYAYGKWIVDKKRKLTSEENYPYLGSHPKYTCPREKPFNLGAQIDDTFYTHKGDENMLKKLVYKFGAVIIALHAGSDFSYFGGGILSRCRRNDWSSVNHAVAVVGYGTENGQDYWLIKNSWGDWWGSNGYIKVARGSNACGIGWWISTVSCSKA